MADHGVIELEDAGTAQMQAADAFVGNRDLDAIRKINPRLRSLEDWLTEHRDEFPVD